MRSCIEGHPTILLVSILIGPFQASMVEGGNMTFGMKAGIRVGVRDVLPHL